MNTLTLARTISHSDKPTTLSLTADHGAPMARYGEQSSLTTLLKDCVTSLLSKPPKPATLILLLALAIPATIAIISTGFNTAEQNLLNSRHITVFLANTSDNNKASRLAETLAANKYIHAAVLRPLDLQTKKVTTIDVHPAETLSKAQLNFVVNELNSHTLVDYVATDENWLDRNIVAIETTKALRWLSISIAALLTAAFVYVLIRSDLPQQRSELRTLNQMGASPTTALKPVMLRCMLLTILAGMIGTLMAWGIIAGLPQLVDISTYEQFLPRSFPAIKLVSLLTLAVFSTVLTVKQFVKTL